MLLDCDKQYFMHLDKKEEHLWVEVGTFDF